jgi:hypothetical protein
VRLPRARPLRGSRRWIAPHRSATIAFVDGSAYFYITARDVPPPDVPHEHPKGPVIALAPARVSLGWLSLIAVAFVPIVNPISPSVF